MGLRISALRFRDFRSYREFTLEGVGDLTVFTGRNAVGKTNILEGIQLLTATTSFRHAQIAQMIRDGESQARLGMTCGDGNRQLDVELLLETGKKRYTVNGKARATADMKGLVPSISFTPDDLELAKKTSSVKRQAIDDLGAQLNGNYHVISRDFEKALRYKNRLLKDEAPQLMVDAINETLVMCGSQLFCYRHALYRKMLPVVKEGYRAIAESGEPFSATYQPSWDYLEKGGAFPGTPLDEGDYANRDWVRERMAEAFGRHAADERARRRSLVGPHNDKVLFSLSGRDASQFASQGQQRSIVLAWKLGEVEMVRRTLGTEPILLLDDVMSELDGTRRDMLVKSVGETTQTFITSTDLSPFNADLLDRARVVELERP